MGLGFAKYERVGPYGKIDAIASCETRNLGVEDSNNGSWMRLVWTFFFLVVFCICGTIFFFNLFV